MIIAIEGGDAVGKHTQSTRLAERLRAKRFAFPNYESVTGKAILRNLKNEWATLMNAERSPREDYCVKDRDTNAMVLQSLMLANRLELQDELLAAKKAGHVVLDRYTISAEVYGGLDGLDHGWLQRTNSALTVQPDIFILLDAPVDEGWKRRPERRDRYESNKEYLERVRARYLQIFEARARARAERTSMVRELTIPIMLQLGPCYEIVDAVGTVEEVEARVHRAAGIR
jgi:thymidylate kinase